MSPCPNSVIRCRLTARLPSCSRCRIGLGQWHRYIAAPAAKRSTHSISKSSANTPETTGYGYDHLEKAAVARDGAFKDSVPRKPSLTAFAYAVSRGQNPRGEERHVQNPLGDYFGKRNWKARASSRIRTKSKSRHLTRRSGAVSRFSVGGMSKDGRARQGVVLRTRSQWILRRLRRRVVATIHRAQRQLKYQRRVVNAKSFRHEIEVRLSSLYPFVSYHPLWKSSYSSIYSAKLYGEEWELSPLLEMDDDGRVLFQKLEMNSSSDFRRAWNVLSWRKKAFQWPRLALYLLHNSPKLCMEFLLATTSCPPYPPFVMVSDCLLYLDKFHYDELKQWKSDENWYNSIICSCLDPERWPSVSISQRGVRLYLKRSDHGGVTRAFQLMSERQIQVNAETALCFVSCFTKFGDADRAMEAFRLLPQIDQPGFDLNSEAVLRHCCKLLTLDSVQDRDGERNFKILPKVLELGVRPDRDMMNVVLSNAFKTGDPQLGLDMLAYMKSQGFELDSYTYLTLLTDAVKHGDRERVDDVLRDINPREELRNNPYIASKIFHAHYTFMARHLSSDDQPAEVFSSMLNIYNELHDVTPLKDLRIVPRNYVPTEEGANLPPSVVALYIMIATYLRCQTAIANVYRIYQRFRELVMEGHETIALLAETDHTYNEFLVAFRRDPRALRYCVQIVEDMLHPHSGVLRGSEPRPIVCAKPTVTTWNILLGAFIYNKQPLAAEKVKEMMRKHGVEFDQVTWNIIVSGYANAQQVPETAAAIKMMEEHGFSVDTYTMKSLRFLRDPERLKAAIDELDKAAEDKFAKVDDKEELLEEGLRRLGGTRSKS
ncbi:hypothetical protein VTN02DRAFT_824 [Thermoascus thermophilus]